MSDLAPALDAELKTLTPTIFGAVAIDLPGRQVNLLDGAGQLSFGGRSFFGRDATYGTLAAIDSLSEGLGDEAPAIRVTLFPASDAAAADLAGPTMQGAPVLLWVGAVNRTTGLAIADPLLLFVGDLDVPSLKSGANERSLELEVVSVFERFMAPDEGARLVPAYHKQFWPGELGLDFVTGVEEPVYWGMEPPAGSVVSGGSFRERWQ